MTHIRIPILVLALLAIASAQSWAQDSSTTTPPDETVTPPETVQPEPAVETPSASDHVARATFCHGVEEHEPVDRIEQVSVEVGEVYYFTEVVDLEGQTVTHRWLRDGQTMAEVPIEIGGPRWRVYSIKSLRPSSAGEWTVQVVTADGSVLQESTLRIGAGATDVTPNEQES